MQLRVKSDYFSHYKHSRHTIDSTYKILVDPDHPDFARAIVIYDTVLILLRYNSDVQKYIDFLENAISWKVDVYPPKSKNYCFKTIDKEYNADFDDYLLHIRDLNLNKQE